MIMTGDIHGLFETLRSAAETSAKHEGSEPHTVAAIKAALAIAEIVATDLHRIADAAEARTNGQ